jgi:hypothetical protein
MMNDFRIITSHLMMNLIPVHRDAIEILFLLSIQCFHPFSGTKLSFAKHLSDTMHEIRVLKETLLMIMRDRDSQENSTKVDCSSRL